MSALTALLRRQSEQNPSASYFNVDILKYQVRVFFLVFASCGTYVIDFSGSNKS
jgi:hypothetical protein